LKNDIILNFNFKDNLIHKIINPIDTVLFSSKKSQDNEIPVIGWIGTPTNTSYLEQCSDSINRLYSEGYSFRLFFTGAEENRVLQIFDPNIDISFENWSLPDEVLLYDRIDIGLMPLPDDNWSRTKAGYKLMLYMSMGKIGVASDVGINRDIIDHGKNAYLIKDKKEWYTIIKSILINYKNMDNLRKEARKTILDNYSKEIAGINFISQLLPGSGNK
jgi:glycosyltransferase involved in cell wall biosynthesis